MLTVHRLALTFLLTAGPFRLACHATIAPGCDDGGPTCCAGPAGAEEAGRTARLAWGSESSRGYVRVSSRTCEGGATITPG